MPQKEYDPVIALDGFAEGLDLTRDRDRTLLTRRLASALRETDLPTLRGYLNALERHVQEAEPRYRAPIAWSRGQAILAISRAYAVARRLDWI